MSAIKFDERGYLIPDGPVELTFTEFKEVFVERFGQDSNRHELLKFLESYLADFKNFVSNSFELWVNGSFGTNRKNPGDVDLVLFLEYGLYAKHEKLIESRFRQSGALFYYKVIDAYVVKTYTQDHPKRDLTHSDRIYWLDWFGWTKRNRQGKRYPKGFIKLTF